MNHSRANPGSRARASAHVRTAIATVCAMLAMLAPASRASAQDAAAPQAAPPNVWFAGTRLVLDDTLARGADFAIGTDDFGLGGFLARLGATLAYQPGQKSVVVTSADRRTIAFTLGDPRYTVAGVTYTAPFAPYAAGSTAYLPFFEIARALGVEPVDDGGAIVLQPQLDSLDIRPAGRVTLVTLRGASALQYRRLSDDSDDDVVLAFSGTASTLDASRSLKGPLLRSVSITVSGTVRNPLTVVHVAAAPGTLHALASSDAPNELTLAFAAPGVALGGTPLPVEGHTVVALSAAGRAPDFDSGEAPAAAGDGEQPAAASAAVPTADTLPTAMVASVLPEPTDQAYAVRVAIEGDVTYEWHRLSDDRWYVDLKPATLGPPPPDEAVVDPSVTSLRVKSFVGPNDHLPTVRIAFTLATPKTVDLQPFDGGVAIVVGRDDDQSGLASAAGEISNGQLIASIVPLPAPSAAVPQPGDAGPSGWKFSPPASGSTATNPRLIVIDPGHGGSDDGAMHNGLVEKELTLDISKRLRAMLIARGWQVKMTRDADVDVYQPNDSARDELQARCDVANNAGAAMFVSIHVNSFTSSDQNGTTTYYFKPDSYPLAQAVHARLAANLPTADDGIRKDNFYVIHHTKMPAILVETAFLSNPVDAGYLRSSEFLQKIASDIASGIGDYASSDKPLSAAGAGNTDGS
jgi:N-acetylmuramoyl-L-alanine amidase